MFALRFILVSMLLLSGGAAIAGTPVTLHLVGIGSDEGHIVVTVFDSKKGWLKTPVHVERVAAVRSDSDTPMQVELDLDAGEYAVQIYHDLDDNGKMKTNFIGIPKEPVGTSNDAKGKFGPPKFRDAKFAVADDALDLIINMTSI